MNSDDIDLLTRANASAATVAGGWTGVLSPLRRLYAVVLAVLVLFWTTVVVIVIVTFALTAWSERRGQQRSTAPANATAVASPDGDARPAAVPASAQMVDHDLVLGDVADVIYFFRDAGCADGVLTVGMTRATVYAETPCASAIPPDTVRRLAGQPVRVRLVGARLFVEALFVGSFQFDVARVWVEMR